MKAVVMILCLAVAGCAAPRDPRETVGNASSYQLCRAMMFAPRDVAQVAQEEAQRRSLDCAPLAQTIMQNEAQADAQRKALATQMLLARPPVYQAPAYQMPRPINCQSYRVGNSVETTCN